MKLYLDASAVLSIVADDVHSSAARSVFDGASDWCSGRHCYVETLRNLHRKLADDDLVAGLADFGDLWDDTQIVELDPFTCQLAAGLGVETGVKTLDALHLGAMWRGGGSDLTMLTFDHRLAQAARYLGMPVVGAAA